MSTSLWNVSSTRAKEPKSHAFKTGCVFEIIGYCLLQLLSCHYCLNKGAKKRVEKIAKEGFLTLPRGLWRDFLVFYFGNQCPIWQILTDFQLLFRLICYQMPNKRNRFCDQIMTGLRQNHDTIQETSRCNLGYIASWYSLNHAAIHPKSHRKEA